MACEIRPGRDLRNVAEQPGLRRIAVFKTTESTQGSVRMDTLLPFKDSLMRVASRTSYVRADRHGSAGNALKHESTPIRPEHFHQTPPDQELVLFTPELLEGNLRGNLK